MKLKNRFGVTLTILVITIIVMMILFGITFTTSTELLRNSQKNKMKAMLYMVKARAEILLDDYLFDYDNEDPSIRLSNLNSVSDIEIKKKLGGEGTIYIKNVGLYQIQAVGFETGKNSLPSKNEYIYCLWNENVLKNQGIDTKNLADGDTIVIQFNIAENKVDVASTKGYSQNGVAIHKLSDF